MSLQLDLISTYVRLEFPGETSEVSNNRKLFIIKRMNHATMNERSGIFIIKDRISIQLTIEQEITNLLFE